MPRTSRTARARRAASAACSLAPSLLGLPLLLGAFLTALWLVGAAPAQADTPARAETLGSTDTLGLGGAGSLDVVPGEVSEPVSATLGTVHQRIGDRAEGTAETAVELPEQTWPVSELHGGARRVVEDLDSTERNASENGLVPVLSATTTATATTERTSGRDAAEHGRTGTGSASGAHRSHPEQGRHRAPAPTTGPGATATAWEHAPERPAAHASASSHEDTRTVPRDAESPGGHLTAGTSAATGGGSAPASAPAGYLTSAPLTAPASAAVLRAAHRLDAVPADPADDPTVSPD